MNPVSNIQARLLAAIAYEWEPVPVGTKTNTILALEKRGLIERRMGKGGFKKSWIQEGEIRLSPQQKVMPSGKEDTQ